MDEPASIVRYRGVIVQVGGGLRKKGLSKKVLNKCSIQAWRLATEGERPFFRMAPRAKRIIAPLLQGGK